MKIYNYQGKANLCGERVRQARQALGLSQEELASKVQLSGVGLEQKALSRIERGLRVVADYELLQLARALEVSPLWLLKESDEKF